MNQLQQVDMTQQISEKYYKEMVLLIVIVRYGE
jgi:hypothetical protein